ncbi:LD-carboxypeptidase [Paenibacillus baekrokdamisoli]|uniref:LD-carboxypeptidase n=1 Tax=Paenibacillus baekrokdamisoli TaxID=1712516 RepID=A0A3G9IWZ5_9BACL|nr:S66 peptidase family protein [Paenibacillus baekrokdamisoli]MBB3069984.1 muramoyltetrapeptide carboxypeptidase LdcA involved in peptidoglycan recycling [Paenibacillus baekrokdamisoli]BBH20665.1 LD-carboxypeptidase [Paenibacillus baekrokdamisoli]
MIKYPSFEKKATIGVTAPSSGGSVDSHEMIRLACSRFEEKGYGIICGDTVWTQSKAKSAPARKRAQEFNDMMRDDSIHLIFPLWGGELLVEIMEFIDFESIKDKWIVGYSDISVLLLAITLRTGLATAHGTSFVDLRGEQTDPTTAMLETVLSTEMGASVLQHSSESFQKDWQQDRPSPYLYQLTEPTYWKMTSTHQNVSLQGRLLGGCIDVIRHLIGTPYGDVRHFSNHFINGEPILWYLENCEINTVDVRRSLVQMKLAGWFENCSGILFGRSNANQPIDGYTIEDVYQDLTEELGVPIIYDIDCGHVPPQITLINGAFAEVEVKDGKGTVRQYFKE